MGKRGKQSNSGESRPKDFVPVVVARNGDQAEKFRQLLEDHDIPVVVVGDGDLEEVSAAAVEEGEERPRGVPVLVPEALLDEAGEVIAEREGFEGFGDEDAEDTEDEAEDFGLDEELPVGWSEHQEDDDFVDDDDDADSPPEDDDDEEGQDGQDDEDC